MRHLFTLFLITITLQFSAQIYSVGHLSINFIDNSRSGGTSISNGVTINGTGRVIGTEVYYPSVVTGYNSAVANGQFPIVVLGHGFLMDYTAYNTIYYYLASKGYIVMLPITEGGTSPNHGYFGRDLSFLANAGINLNTLSSPASLAKFNGKVLAKAAIGGHSMGGGCSFFAAANNNTVTCLFNFAAADITPSSITSATAVTAPTLVFSGEQDCIADTNIQNNHFTNLASNNKFHVILKSLTHCDFSNGTNTNCNLGQSLSGCSNSINNNLAFDSYMNYLEPFLNSQLKNNCNEGQRFMDSINTISSLRVGLKSFGNISCAVISVKEYEDNSFFNIYPNPTTGKLLISSFANINAPMTFELYDISGRLVTSKTEHSTNSKKELSIENLDNGIYTLHIMCNEHSDIFKIIKQ